MGVPLTESAWTGFRKKLKLEIDDAALVKALARHDKASGERAEVRQEALRSLVAELRKQIPAQAKRRKELGDKVFNELKDQLHGLLEAAEKLQKTVDAEADDEEESPALLTTKLVPLIREVRKGELVLSSLVATAGKETVVLLSRKSISPARGKLLKEQMANPAGLKFIRGDCRFEQNALTFVVQAPAGGLAKRIKEALLGQTGLRLKVRVRGEGGEVEENGDDADADGAGAGARAAAAPPPQEARADAATAFNARLAALLPAAKAAAAGVRAKVAEAGQAARGGAFDAAHELLDEAERLLEAGARHAARTADAVARWQAQRDAAISSLKAVAGRIAQARHAQSAQAIVEIQGVIRNLPVVPSTAQQVAQLQQYLRTDGVVQDVCEMAEDFRTPLLRVLAELNPQAA